MPKSHPPLTAARLREMLSYDPETGVFRWRAGRGPIRAGSIAGCDSFGGYVRIRVCGVITGAHRLAWLYAHGVWPARIVDHIDGNPANNRLRNLRQASDSENQQNRAVGRNNKSGHTGICWQEDAKKWKVRIRARGREINVGLFRELDDAVTARQAAKSELHTFHPNDRETKTQITERVPRKPANLPNDVSRCRPSRECALKDSCRRFLEPGPWVADFSLTPFKGEASCADRIET